MTKVPFVITTVIVLAIAVFWTIETKRVVFVFLFFVYAGAVAITNSFLSSDMYSELVVRRVEFGTGFFVWFLLIVLTIALITVSAGAFGAFSGESEDVWRVPFFLAVGGWVSAVHSLIVYRQIVNKGSRR